MKRYFEFVEGTSSKFWEIWREDTKVFTRYGKIGAAGQTTIKDEGGEEKAQKLYDKLVKEKTGKGYVEKTTGGSPTAAPPAPEKAAPAAASPAPSPAKPAPAPAKPAPVPAAAAVPAGTRRFEFSEDGSNKFWEVTLDGNAHTVRYGKIGTPGQEKTKSFGSEAAAQKDAEKLIAEKTKKGYVEVTAAAGAGGPTAPALEGPELDEHLAGIDHEPTNAEKRLVFGDWLQSKGHPWGTLIALNHAVASAPNASKRAELAKEETAFLQSQGTAILGDLARAGRPTRFTWDHGFVEEAVIASPTDKVVLAERMKALFALPAARFLKRLVLHGQPARLTTYSDWDSSPENIAAPWAAVYPVLAEAPKTLKSLAFGEPPPTGASAYVAKPDLAKVSRALPHLESLEVQCAGSDNGLGSFELPELRSLEIRLANADDADLASIRTAKLPKLERLAVWLGGYSNCSLDDVHPAAEWDEDNEDASRYPETYPASDLEALEIYDLESNVSDAAVATFCAGPWPSS